MWIQQSFRDEEEGALYLVPTPIGNLEDITYRALKILKEVDLIAAEDTRQTKKLCNHFEISTKLVSYHDHNKQSSGFKLLEEIKAGKKIALVSDAGMPAISDPGYELVVSCIEEKIAVIPLPGANAALPALIASGLPTDHFYFYGFLHRQKKDKKKQLETLNNIKCPIIFYESPHRIKETLQNILEQLGDRKISVCRELTKKFEEFIRGNVSELISYYENVDPRGEYCLILEGTSEETIDSNSLWWQDLSIEQHIEHYIAIQLSSKEAIKQVAKDRNIQKREVYQVYHNED
ncbi:16S rRNA (cytidine(1402)-2'-O)-methyltransferase [Anaerobacillus isosaccharinicus]|uniref:Ribosomal RNA small subunit methyltransferase I n=1 Tax=Anaerobacillus isosaccharinicus TaxID=1532552 RepID=A0A7S7RCY5_9BACI|nr:16S rRNA (cytidine(1402)-2'-O)-methyltransferase [Anaerobacillus isosaccharinicus]MBA5584144.1 16S rRNA (cytidine(1402)-2'-O)-methyltransferase [Anaerobacillus isosaccharinicus]QOY37447.1 16S rRNA (cytidine(1402)-2'-O)-methyltransferase [Anaerobacillus isosaccharinicus]